MLRSFKYRARTLQELLFLPVSKALTQAGLDGAKDLKPSVTAPLSWDRPELWFRVSRFQLFALSSLCVS
jgi:hypothetical protein